MEIATDNIRQALGAAQIAADVAFHFGERAGALPADGSGKTDLTPPDWPGSFTSRDAFWLE